MLMLEMSRGLMSRMDKAERCQLNFWSRLFPSCTSVLQGLQPATHDADGSPYRHGRIRQSISAGTFLDGKWCWGSSTKTAWGGNDDTSVVDDYDERFQSRAKKGKDIIKEDGSSRNRVVHMQQKKVVWINGFVSIFSKLKKLVADLCPGTFGTAKDFIVLPKHRHFVGSGTNKVSFQASILFVVETFARQELNDELNVMN